MTLSYWHGQMDWPLEAGWTCEICGVWAGLTWGFVHGVCRCNRCHAQYTMRDDDQARTILTTPRSRIKPEWREVIEDGWALYGTPYDEWTDAQWNNLSVPKEKEA